jgi:hypothetical protein
MISGPIPTGSPIVIPIIGRSSDIKQIPNPAKPEQKIFSTKAQLLARLL